MSQLTPPAAGDDSRALWKVVAQVVKQLNALDSLKISRVKGSDKFTLSEGSARLDLQESSVAGDSGDLLWWNVMANGLPAYAQFASTSPVNDLPPGASTQNPNV